MHASITRAVCAAAAAGALISLGLAGAAGAASTAPRAPGLPASARGAAAAVGSAVSPARPARPVTAYVINNATGPGHGDPDQHRHQQGRQADQGRGVGPCAIAITPDGKTAYVP